MLRKGHVSIINILMQTFQFDLGFIRCLVHLFLVLRLVMQIHTWNKFSNIHLGLCG